MWEEEQKQRDLFPISLIQKSELTVSEMIKPNLFTLKMKKLKKTKKTKNKTTFKQKL